MPRSFFCSIYADGDFGRYGRAFLPADLLSNWSKPPGKAAAAKIDRPTISNQNRSRSKSLLLFRFEEVTDVLITVHCQAAGLAFAGETGAMPVAARGIDNIALVGEDLGSALDFVV